jgi:C_GCAxxG_C_C family probable redox protein
MGYRNIGTSKYRKSENPKNRNIEITKNEKNTTTMNEKYEKTDERVARAVDNFMAGYGCCQSVVAAFADIYGLDDTMAKKIAAGFGGGVGRMRMMCGAVSAIVMLAGIDCGQTEGSDREGKSACYKVVQQLLAQSKADNGSLICAEILGLKGSEKATASYVASPRTAEYYKTRPCAAKVESAARIFAEYLKRKQQAV